MVPKWLADLEASVEMPPQLRPCRRGHGHARRPEREMRLISLALRSTSPSPSRPVRLTLPTITASQAHTSSLS